MSTSPGAESPSQGGEGGMRQSSSSNALNAQDEKDVVDTLVVPPRGRCLTANCEAVANRGYDNARGEYILFVNDVIGKVGWNRYQVLDILGHGTFGQVAKCKRVARASDASGGTRRFWRASKKRGASVEDLSAMGGAAGASASSALEEEAQQSDGRALPLGDEVDMDDPSAPQEFAVKVVKNRPAYLNQGFVEIQILELLNQQIDPNDEHRLVRLVDYFTFRQHLILVFELLSMNLYELVKQNQFRGLSLRLTRLFIGQLLKALAALARAKIIHCFPEADHQLLTNRGFLFLADVERLVDFDARTGEVRDWRGLRVANYDPATRSIAYVQPRRLVVNEAPSTHVEFSDRAEAKRWRKPGAHTNVGGEATFSQRLSVVTTSEHRMFAREVEADGAQSRAYRKVLAHTLASHARQAPLDAVQFLSLAAAGASDADGVGERALATLVSALALTSDVVVPFLRACGAWLARGDESAHASWRAFFAALGGESAAERATRMPWLWQLSQLRVRHVLAGALDALGARDGVVLVDSAEFRERLLVLLMHGGYAATFDSAAGGRWRVMFADEHVAAAAAPSVSVSRGDVVRTHKLRSGRTWCFDLSDGLVVVRRAHRGVGGAVTQASQATIQSNCDLKPENILLENLVSPNIKLIDFGSACFEGQTVYSYIQSRFYRSPEVLLGVPYNRAIDIWSLGCISAELFLGLPLLPGSSEYDQMRRIVDMRGLPPPRLLRRGKSTHKLFVRTAPNFDYRLKTASEYTLSTGIELAPPKRYLKHDTLHDLVTKYPMKRSLTPDEITNEEQQRVAFLHFLQGLLNVDPARRWTATQAAQHPFVLNEPLPEGGWKPAAPPASKTPGKGEDGGDGADNAGAPPLAGTMTAAEAAAHVLAADASDTATTAKAATTVTTAVATAAVAVPAAAAAAAVPVVAAAAAAVTVTVKSEVKPAAAPIGSVAAAVAALPAVATTAPSTAEVHAETLKRERALTSVVVTAPEAPAVRSHDTDSKLPKDSRVPRSAPMAMPGVAAAGGDGGALAQSFVAAPYVPHPQLSAWGLPPGAVAPGGVSGPGVVSAYVPVASSYPPVLPLTPWSATFGQLPPGVAQQQQQHPLAPGAVPTAQQQQQLQQQQQQQQQLFQQAQQAQNQFLSPTTGTQPQAIGRGATLFAPPTHYNSAFVFGSPPTMTSQPRSYQASFLGSAAALGSTPWAVGSSGARGVLSSSSGSSSLATPAQQSSLLTPNATPGTTPRSTPRTPRSVRAQNAAAAAAAAAVSPKATSLQRSGGSGGHPMTQSAGRVRADSNTSDAQAVVSTGELVFSMDDDEGAAAAPSPRRQRSDTGGTNTSSLSSRSSVVEGSLDDVEFFEHLQIGNVDVGTQGTVLRQATPPTSSEASTTTTAVNKKQ